MNAEGWASPDHSAQYAPPPKPVRPASTAGGRSLAREPMVRKRAASPPAFAGEGARSSRLKPLPRGRGLCAEFLQQRHRRSRVALLRGADEVDEDVAGGRWFRGRRSDPGKVAGIATGRPGTGPRGPLFQLGARIAGRDRKSTRLNPSH